MKYNVSAHVIRIWLTSVVVSPILITCLGIPLFHWHMPDLGVGVIMIVIGAMCSLPSLGVLYVVGSWLSGSIDKLVVTKILLTFVGAVLTYLPFFVVNNFKFRMDVTSLFLCMTYLLSIVAGIWLYKLQPVNDAPKIGDGDL